MTALRPDVRDLLDRCLGKLGFCADCRDHIARQLESLPSLSAEENALDSAAAATATDDLLGLAPGTTAAATSRVEALSARSMALGVLGPLLGRADRLGTLDPTLTAAILSIAFTLAATEYTLNRGASRN